MGRPTPYYLLDAKIRPRKTALEHTDSRSASGFDQIAPPAYGVVPCPVPSAAPSPSSEAAPQRAKKEGTIRTGGAPPASPSSHGAAPRRRLIVVAPVLSFLIPPPPPPPCTSSVYLLPNAGTLARGGGGGSRVLRQPASRGARAHRIREGDWAADPRRRRPHHPRGRGSCGLQTYWRPVVYILIGAAED